MVDHKTSLNKYRKTEIISNTFLKHNSVILKINYEKNRNMQMLNNILLNKQQVNKKIKEGIKKWQETNKNGNTATQNLWDRLNTVQKRIVIDDTSLPQKTARVKNKNPNKPNLKSIGTRKRRTYKPKLRRRKEVIKIKAEIKQTLKSYKRDH